MSARRVHSFSWAITMPVLHMILDADLVSYGKSGKSRTVIQGNREGPNDCEHEFEPLTPRVHNK